MQADIGVELAGMFDPEGTRDVIHRVDALGGDFLWWADYRFYRDVYSMLTRTALYSDRLRYGTFVTDPFARHPALTALAMATADELGGGRGVLGLGAGVSGLREMRIPRERPAIRISEAIDVIRALWRDGEATYEGETVSFDGHLDFAARPHIPIFVASNSRRTLSVAGRRAEGVIVEGLCRPAMLDYVFEHVQRGLDASGRTWSDLYSVARLDLCIHPDPQVARELARHRVQHYVSVHGAARWPDLAELLPDGLEDEIKAAGFTHDPAVVEPLVAQIPDEAGELIALVGDPDEVGRQLERVSAMPISQISVFPIPSPPRGHSIPDVLELFASVLRQLSQAGERTAP
ncbi:LLM class flavin-dependent oxidoreductase [Egibacter rhizosphaerae]|uniref:LLM class flavin-dependent oxidoreductase n=1 Tax=Egibacter rhizosphaerae TaxID=1670831 RepID=A0A411YBH5_9ACTN|nr:LLM class flavin-dependent oxidoreductase [Egibacter rhizosphaerae]QBI18528.1 LLM class flavin-dependent oxidoreductase [Egibacter rhizosphaerae]